MGREGEGDAEGVLVALEEQVPQRRVVVQEPQPLQRRAHGDPPAVQQELPRVHGLEEGQVRRRRDGLAVGFAFGLDWIGVGSGSVHGRSNGGFKG